MSLPPLGIDGQLSVLSLENLLEQITHGHLPDDHLRLLASRLSRINHKSNEKQRNEFASMAHTTMYDLAVAIFDALEKDTLPPFNNANEANEERKVLVRLLAKNPQARKYLLVLNAGFVKILIPGEDTLIMKGFSQEEARSSTKAFEEYVENHKDEIEALRIIYNNQGEPITYALLKDLEEKLLAVNSRFNARFLWNAYAITHSKDVVPLKNSNEKDALTNLIQLVRYAFHTIPELKSLPSIAAQRFELWCGQNQRPLTETQKVIMKQIVGYIVSNGTYTNIELREENITVFAQMVQNFGSVDVVDEVLGSLSGWMLKAG
jgi:type I restriction enzyme R subunit